ncbi:MAG: GNAT family N-acetyltransferase [Pseudomonadota bacterium]|nr:GNAT family N-acetyltransferase [Pseudomonadota bacterium]
MSTSTRRVTIRRRAPAAAGPFARAIRKQFDLAPRSTRLAIDVALPAAGGDWQIGAIVGNSGSGKSQILQAAFPHALAPQRPWPADRAIVDCLGLATVEEAARLLSAVGLGSVPAWTRPFHALSGGEQFRAELARSLASQPMHEQPHKQQEDGGGVPGLLAKGNEHAANVLVAIDEFTSCLDRVVARSACVALARYVRRAPGRQLVVASCHADVLAWLAPDWTLRMPAGSLSTERPPPPRLRWSLVERAAHLWPRFAQHHYLAGTLHAASRCYAALVAGRPAAFCATLTNLGHAGCRRVTRLVAHPDYQGLGLGQALLDAVAAREAAGGARISIVTAHPALVARLGASPRWTLRYTRGTPHAHRFGGGRLPCAGRRKIASFLWIGKNSQ